jgi:hypothetical protein
MCPEEQREKRRELEEWDQNTSAILSTLKGQKVPFCMLSWVQKVNDI